MLAALIALAAIVALGQGQSVEQTTCRAMIFNTLIRIESRFLVSIGDRRLNWLAHCSALSAVLSELRRERSHKRACMQFVLFWKLVSGACNDSPQVHHICVHRDLANNLISSIQSETFIGLGNLTGL